MKMDVNFQFLIVPDGREIREGSGPTACNRSINELWRPFPNHWQYPVVLQPSMCDISKSNLDSWIPLRNTFDNKCSKERNHSSISANTQDRFLLFMYIYTGHGPHKLLSILSTHLQFNMIPFRTFCIVWDPKTFTVSSVNGSYCCLSICLWQRCLLLRLTTPALKVSDQSGNTHWTGNIFGFATLSALRSISCGFLNAWS